MPEPLPMSSAPAVGSRWRQPRTGRILKVERVDADGLVWGPRTTRAGNWARDASGFLPADFVQPYEDPLLDNLMGWRWVAVDDAA